MKTNKTTYVVTIPMFSLEVLFLLGLSAEEAQKEIGRRGQEVAEPYALLRTEGNTSGAMVKLVSGHYAVWVEDKKKIGDLIHEITHVVTYILRERNTPLNESTEEVYAYLIGSISKEVISQMKKYRQE